MKESAAKIVPTIECQGKMRSNNQIPSWQTHECFGKMAIIEIHQQKRTQIQQSTIKNARLVFHHWTFISVKGQFLDRQNLFQKKRPGSSVSLQFLEDWVVGEISRWVSGVIRAGYRWCLQRRSLRYQTFSYLSMTVWVSKIFFTLESCEGVIYCIILPIS